MSTEVGLLTSVMYFNMAQYHLSELIKSIMLAINNKNKVVKTLLIKLIK